MTLLDENETQTAPTETGETAEAGENGPRAVTRGLRIRGIRLPSVAKIAFIFFGVGYVATLGALIVLWNLMQWVGFIADVEEILTTSLGLDTVTISGADLLGLAVVGLGIVAVFGFVMSVLAAVIYNAAGNIMGGLLVDTTLTRRRRTDRTRRPRRRLRNR